MKNKILIIFVIILSSNLLIGQSFKKLYKESFKYLEVNDFKHALPVLMKMHDMKPDHANTNFSIGNCLMNISHREHESIPYYEKAMEGITIGYRVGNHREKKAPLDVIELLGRAYHKNYDFDQAIDKFEFYSNFLAEDNWDDKRANNRRIRQSKYAMELQQNPVDVDVVPIKAVNSIYSEYRPKVNAEENIMYFTSRRPGGSSEILDDEGRYYEDIYYSEKKHNVWTKPELVQDLINVQENSSCLYLSSDAQMMYLSMVNNDPKLGNIGRGIYESNLNGEHWSEPEFLNEKINSKYWETYASLDIYGNLLFFVSDRDGGYGGKDIWMVKKLPTGDWAEPQNLGEPINTEYDEESPYLHPDGKTLYFSSKGHKVMGGYDIFKSTFQDDLSWTAPENMGYPINTVVDDLFFSPTVNGKRAYFSSYRSDGVGDYDIYRMNLIAQKEADLAVYKGVVKDTKGNVVKDIVISIFDENMDDKYGIYRPNDLTGRFLFVLQPGHNYEIIYEHNDISISDTINVPLDVDGVNEYTKVVRVTDTEIALSSGFVVDGDILSLSELDDPTNIELSSFDTLTEETELASENEVVKENTNTQKLSNEEIVEEDDKHVVFYKSVYYKSESYNLSSASRSVLDELIILLKDNPKWGINSVGHTDLTGSKRANQILSVLRAESVKTYLYNRGIDFKRISAFGMGDKQPVSEDNYDDGIDDTVGKDANRRVELQLVK
jgi:outer membrane protein OmpA-like peptidoglycan-associated protein